MNFTPISRFVYRNTLKVKRNSPQILFYAGIVGTVATSVLASRATLRAQPVVKRLKENRAELDSFHLEKKVDQEVYNKEVIQQYTTVTIELTKLYGPTLLVGVGSLVALTKSHQQLNSRNAALTVAYTGLFKTFESYRDRVRNELGVDRDREFLHGTIQQQIEYKDKNGKSKTKEITTINPLSKASLTYMFDHHVPTWDKSPGYNQNYLDGVQDWANIQLKKRGHLFLNDVFDLLQIPRTQDGQLLGWVFRDLGNNDMYIDLGHRNDGEFLAGYKRDVMLEFNIHGPILGEI